MNFQKLYTWKFSNRLLCGDINKVWIIFHKQFMVGGDFFNFLLPFITFPKMEINNSNILWIFRMNLSLILLIKFLAHTKMNRNFACNKNVTGRNSNLKRVENLWPGEICIKRLNLNSDQPEKNNWKKISKLLNVMMKINV